MAQNYIFGYGSLIDTHNRSLTLPHSREIYPVTIKNFQRQWNVRSNLRSFTVLGVTPQSGHECTGLIFPVSPEELEELDFRERSYQRQTIFPSNILSFSQKKNIPQKSVWTYIPNSPQFPSQNNPITQTYLDLVLRGCLEINEEFARQFIRTTPWHSYWINDRTQPRTHHLLNNPQLEQHIDTLLQQEIPAYFTQRI